MGIQIKTRPPIVACIAALLGFAAGDTQARTAMAQAVSQGCARAAGNVPESGPTDLKDAVTHWGFVRRCDDARPAILTIDLVEYYEGARAIREAKKDGEALEADVDPVVHVRNRNPKLRRLGIKPDADVRMFDCAVEGCPARKAQLDELPWDRLYRFRLQNGLIVYIELPYTP